MNKIIHWWHDSSGRHTCHENIKGASFDKSLLGEIREVDGFWRIKLKDEVAWRGEYKNKFGAMKALEAEVGGRQLNDYD